MAPEINIKTTNFNNNLMGGDGMWWEVVGGDGRWWEVVGGDGRWWEVMGVGSQ